MSTLATATLGVGSSNAGNLITRQGQAQLDDLLLGPGTAFGVKLVAGGTAPLRTSDRPRGGMDGDTPGTDWMAGRVQRVMVNARSRGSATVAASIDELAAKFRPLRDSTIPFAWWRWGDASPRVLYVRPRRAEWDADHELWTLGMRDDIPLELYAPDPRWYSLAEHLASLSPPSPEAGRTYPRTYPMAFGGGTGGIATLTNAGSLPTHPTITIHGPATNPRLENVTTGRTLELAITVADGEFLEVDMYEHTVLLGGTASRYNAVTSADFWPLVKGANEVRFAVDSGGGNGADVAWRDAWM